MIVLALLAPPPPAASADPPRRARIVEDVGMAGVRIGAGAPLDSEARPPRVTSGPLAKWGGVAFGFCYHGSTCSWKIPGGGMAGAEIGPNSGRVTHLDTSSRRWRTRRGVHAGSSLASVRSRYGNRPVITTCRFSPYGARVRGVVVGRARKTFLAVSGSRVDRIWVVARRITAGGC